MPKYQVTSPDGKTFEVTAPDGASQDEVLAYAQSQFQKPAPVQPTQKPAPPANTAVAVNAANKGIAGIPDAILNTPYNVLNLAKAGFGTAANAMGRPDLAPDLTPTPDFARRGMQAMGFIRPEAEPQTAGQRMLDATVQGGVGAMLSPASSARQAMATGLMGATSGLSGQATKEATGSDTAAMAASLLTPAAAMYGAGRARQGAQSLAAARERNATRDATLKAAQEAGYLVPPSTVKPSMANQILESISGKAATQQAVSQRNWDVTDELARKALKLPENTPLTEEAMKAVRREAYNTGYAPIETQGQIRTGRLYRDALDDIQRRYTGAERSFPGAVPNDVANMIKPLRRLSFDAGDALKMTQVLRDDASKAFAAGDAALGKANRAAANAIEDQIERGLSAKQNSAKLLDEFRGARQLMAKSHTVEQAIKSGSGSIDANKIAAQLQKGAPLTGELKTIGEFANTFRKANQTPQVVGSPGVSKLGAVMSGLMGGGGALAAGPYGAAAGAAIPFIAPAAAQKLILSNRYQKGLAPNYEQGQIAKLLAQLNDPTQAALQQNLLFANELNRKK